MPCYYPMQGYRSKDLSPNGKRKLVFSRSSAINPDLPHNQLTVACGQCIGCRLERSRQWAVRCMHEASLYEDNCFITLTYSNESLSKMCPDMSLNVSHFQKFMKRLRKRFGEGIRFFHCGEYGSLHRRPHYHAILFNFDFHDKFLWKTQNEVKLYRSPSLEELWPFGHSSVGSATFESAAYVARYILKKEIGLSAKEHYEAVDLSTGEFINLKPEYVTMSRRPGIGKGWFDKFSSDVYPRDEVILRNRKFRPPKYYDSQFELINPDEFLQIKEKRVRSSKEHADNNTPDRLEVRRKVKMAQISRLVRDLD